jgi:succinate dehydrogenase / fumarate reductase flavoprotein subunit
MGGLWVDYELQSTIPGLFVAGEANFSDHGANRLGASALMQTLADGYFVLPYTIQNYLADQISVKPFPTDLPEFKESEKATRERLEKLISIKGKQTVDTIHKKLGQIMWDYVGMSRNKEGLEKAIKMIRELKEEFWSDVKIPGGVNDLNNELIKADRLADFLEMGELMAIDARDRDESCGGHFREEYQTEEGEALRNDKDFKFVSVYEFKGEDDAPVLHKEELEFENIKLVQRSYK